MATPATPAAPGGGLFRVLGFHHVELWCGDASSAWRRFAHGLGMRLVALSDQSTGNGVCASYVLRRARAR